METRKTKTVEYKVRAELKQIGRELDEKNLRRLLETKLKSSDIFHLPSGYAEIVEVARIKNGRNRKPA